ncbi:testis-specific gene 10 protein isoform X2 [Columba livia]|uniref:testis-specific gene 10 protein isoform X2 n=1 Tax=Columba livia TaxID=8932 RepID=UPI0031BB4B0E
MRPVSQFPTHRRDHLSSPERPSFPRSPWDTASKASEKANRLPPLESSAPPRGRCWRRARRAVPRAGETCGRMPALRCPFPPSRPAGAAVGAGRCRERGGRQRLGRGAGAAAGECAGQRRRPHLARAPAMSARRSPERRGGRAESRPKIEDLKNINYELRQHVMQLLAKKQVVESQVDRFTCENDHLCKELAVIGELSEQLEKELLFNTADKDLEEAKIQIRHQQKEIKKLEHTVKTLKSVIIQTEAEINEGKSPSRLDAFIKTLEEDRDYYKRHTENLLKVLRKTFSSPEQTSTCGSMSQKLSSIQRVCSDAEVLKILREHEELKSTLKKYERHVAEIQGNIKVLTAERDKIVNLYERAQEEISRLRQEVIKCPRSPKSTMTAQAMLRHVEIERDIALSDFQRMTTERDSLREQLKLDSEQLEQMSKVMLMKDTINSLETEIKRLARRALDSETELNRREAEYVSLSLLNEKTEQSLSETQRNLIKTEYEMQLTQEKVILLEEKIDNFSRQSLLQKEEICALKETIAQLDKEKATLQDCVEEGREKIATFEESLAIKEKIISDLKILITELEHSTKKSAEALCICEKDITSLHQQLQETNKELAETNKNRESLAQENDRLQEHLCNIKQENQVLYKKLAKYQNELDDVKLKAQDSNTDIVRLKGILKSKERENCELLENYHKACEQRESWEEKWQRAETDCSSVRMALISAESEKQWLKEKIETLETEMEQLQSKCVSSHCEIELLRKQLGNERATLKHLESLLVSSHDKGFQAQRAKQEKDTEIQLLKEQLSLAEHKLAVQSQDFTQLRNRAAQLESELAITKRQLETERFERERAIQELRRQNHAVSYQLGSTLRTSSPDHSHYQPPDWSLDLSQEGNFKDNGL